MQGAPGGALQAAISRLEPRRDSNATAVSSGGVASPTSNAITAGFGGGGLASSPNVPAPGTSINPATGKPHTAGLTRAELADIKAKGQGLLDPAPTGSEIRRASVIKQSFNTPDVSTGYSGGALPKLSQLSGREQAAAQLTGSPALLAPTSPTARKGSVVEDIEKNVARLGQRAYEAVPPAIKDIFAEPKGKGVEGSPVKARRGSAAALIDNVKFQANRLSATVQSALNDPTNASTSPLATAAIGTQPITPVALPHAPVLVPVTSSPVVLEARRPSVLESIQAQAKKIGQDVQTQLHGVQQQLDYGRTESALKTGPGAASTSPVASTTSSGGVLDNIQLQARRLSQGVQNQLDYGRTESALKTGSGAASTEPSLFTEVKDNIQLQARRLSQNVQNQLEYGRTESALKTGPTPTAVSQQPGVIAQVKDFLQSAYSAAADPPAPNSTSRTSISVPSQENQGPRPGESTFGAGSLTGQMPATEGTAPAAPSHPIAGTGTGLSAGAVVADLFGTNKGPDAASGPDSDKIAANLRKAEPVSADSDPHVIAADLNRSSNLSPPLPQTDLGLGAAYGATDLGAVAGVSTPNSASEPIAAGETSNSAAPVAPGRAPNDRTDSLTSVTAIRHGQAGDLAHHEPSPLAAGAIDEDSSTASGQESTTRGTGPNHTTSLAPGSAEHGVGHPSTRDHDDTSRVPGAYPSAQHDPHTSSETHTPASSSHTPVKAEEVNSAVAKGDLDVKPAPFAPGGIAGAGSGASTSGHSGSSLGNGHVKDSHGHNRTSSTASGSGKKVGFMQKLKGEIKVISGKISHDDEKVELGEKLKHGEI